MKDCLEGLPSKIKVGPITYRIESVAMNYLDDAYGDCDPAMGLIRIERGHSQDRTVQTVLHEVMHALWRLFDLAEKEKEEPVVTRISYGLHMVMLDNPKLLAWLLKRGGCK